MYRYKGVKVNGKKIDEHRHIMGVTDPDMIVHHIDGNGRNNDFDNLAVMTRSEHLKLHGFGTIIQSTERHRIHPSSGAYNRGCRCNACKKIRHDQYLERKNKRQLIA